MPSEERSRIICRLRNAGALCDARTISIERLDESNLSIESRKCTRTSSSLIFDATSMQTIPKPKIIE
jgi:hypothetical protein